MDEEEEKQNLLDGYIKEINRLKPTARVIPNGEYFDLSVCFTEVIETEYKVSISPLLSNKTEAISENILFKSLALTQLSEFYKISVSDGKRTVERIIIIPTGGLPEDREKQSYQVLLRTKNAFTDILRFSLATAMPWELWKLLHPQRVP